MIYDLYHGIPKKVNIMELITTYIILNSKSHIVWGLP